MARFWRLLSVLLWKNWLLKRRHPLSTILEVLLPVSVLVLLMLLRTQVDHKSHATTAYIRPKMFVRVGHSEASPPFPMILQRCLATRSHIAFVPGNASWVQDMVLLLSMQFPDLKDVALLYPDEASLELYVQTPEYGMPDPTSHVVNPRILGAVVFHSLGPVYDYSLRLNHSWAPSGFPDVKSIMDTKGSAVNDLYLGLNLIPQMQYALSGFLTLQQVVDSYIIFSSQEASVCSRGSSRLLCRRSFQYNLPEHISVAPFPTTAYTDDSFQAIAKKVMAVLYLLGFMFPVSRLLRHMVLEKEDRLKEGMRMMGMTETAVNAAWLITYGVQFGVTSGLITVVTWSSLFAHSDKSVVFAYFFVFGLSSIGLCFFLSTFFSRARTAASVGALAFLGAFFPYYTLVDQQAPGWSRIVGSLSSPTAFALGTVNFADYEQGHVGLRWSNIFQPSSGINFGVCLIMMLADGLLYCALGWYCDKVLPRAHGVPRPWYFPLQRSYWAASRPPPGPIKPGRPSNGDLESGLLISKSRESLERWGSGFSSDSGMSDAGRGEVGEEPLGAGFEAVGRTLRRQEKEARCVQVCGLRKEFGSGGDASVAVAGLELVLYEGQITALLGHNGAGKSTTIAMLTGLLPPTAGDARVRGKSIHTHMDAIRRQLGVCPQHDILFPELTVEEHLQLFATFKGVDRAGIPVQVTNMIQNVGLADKRHARAGSLSGGMKRKLSVGIALIGGSRVVVLDEPSSGMDPYSQRAIWRLLKRSKAGRCILLTTHSMEEADVLGDRIAIMAHGQLRAAASSLYLKNRFGVGYTLTLIKKNACDIAAIEDTVRRHVPVATLVSNVASELAFRLPLAHTAAFPALFHDLDAATTADKGISGYGVSVTTLEEVFLRIARSEEEEVGPPTGKPQGNGERLGEAAGATSGSGQGPAEEKEAKEREQGGRPGPSLSKVGSSSRWVMHRVRRKMFWKHCRALLRKRWLMATRGVRSLLFQLLIPVAFLLLGLTLLLLKPHPNLPAVTLDMHEYNAHIAGKQPTAPVPLNLTYPVATELSAWLRSGSPQLVTPPSFVFPHAEHLLEQAVAAAGPEEGPALLNLSSFLIESRNLTYESRYGAILLGPRTASGSVGYSVLHNTTSQHAAPMYMNLVHDALLKDALGSHDVGITVRNHPLPSSYSQRRQRRDIGAFSAAIIVNVAFAFIPASFAVAIVKERETGAKAQQVLSGVSLVSYWVSTGLWDWASYLLPASLALLLFALFGVDEFIGPDSLLPTALLLLAYGPAVAALTYCFTFGFTHHATAQNAILLLHLFSGLLLSLASFIMSLIKNTRRTNHNLKALFRLFPGFCLADGLSSLALREQGLDPDLPTSAFAWDVSGANIVYLALEALLYFCIALLLDYLPPLSQLWHALPTVPRPWSRRAPLAPAYSLAPSTPTGGAGPGVVPPSPRLILTGDSPYADEDADVAAERARVEGPSRRGSLVRLSGLRKVYPGLGGGPGKVAVQSLSFGIGPGECFGFLGVNGAGKTTTLGMLTGEVAPSDGTAYIVGNDIRTNQTAARRLVGYCPQRDPLLDLLTPREHLQLYARIKGVPEKNLLPVVEAKLRELELVGCADARAGLLSGGNKRKLSVAQAMVGDPPIIILDEPSTGMDPSARRFLWDVVSRLSLREGRCAVLLTTHSMAEAQALCSTIGIMTAGRLRCLGSPQHLKTRFGEALELEVKAVTPSLAALSLLCERVLTSIPALLRCGQEPDPADLQDTRFGDVGSLRAGLDLSAALPAEAVVAAACALGDEARAQLLLGSEAGAGEHEPGEHDTVMTSVVAEQIARDGWISVQTFCEWWLVAEQSLAIDTFVRSTFPGAALLEHTAATFRYQLPREGGRSLAQVFAALEAHRAAVGIAEYSVGQTTLEAIFNGFAARQEDADRA